MKPSHPLYQLLSDDCHEAFERLHIGLPLILHPSRELPVLDFQLWDKHQLNARVRHRSNDASRATVEVNTGLLLSVYNSIEASSESVHRCILGSGPVDHIDRDDLCSIVYDAALHFVLLHEMFHVYEGHMAFLHARKGMSELQEQGRCFDGSDEDLDPETAYFLEFEADGSALVSLLTHVEFEPLIHVVDTFESLDTHCTMVQDFPGIARNIGFRLILCAAWIVASLMEIERRPNALTVLPKARMLSLVSTLMSWYAQLDNLRQTEAGELVQQLDGTQASALRDFLQEVARPVLMERWPLQSTHRDVEATVRYNAKDIEQFIGDLQTLLLRQPTTTVASQQVASCERLRMTVEPMLEPYRYFSLNDKEPV